MNEGLRSFRGALLSRPVAATDRPVLCYVKGGAASLMFDAGNSSRHAREVLGRLDLAGEARPDYVLVSHGHCDHWFGLSEFDSVALCSRKTMDLVRRRASQDWSSAEVGHRLARGEEDEITKTMLDAEYGVREGTIDLRLPDLAFEGRLDIDLGGTAAVAECLGGSHAEGSTVLFVERDGLLLLGDILYVRDGGREEVEALFERLFSYGAEAFVDSHVEGILTRSDMEKRREDIIGGR
jgi:glyoxylase-like metal-dependent hydrolase (beta-lactamase superfamily II)